MNQKVRQKFYLKTLSNFLAYFRNNQYFLRISKFYKNNVRNLIGKLVILSC